MNNEETPSNIVRIHYTDITKLPTRESIVDNDITQTFRSRIEEKQSILFIPNSITEQSDFSPLKGANKSGNTPTYKIYMFGIIPGGTKVCVILEDIDVFFDIKLDNEQSENNIKQLLASDISVKTVKFIKTEIVKGKPLKGFSISDYSWLRIFFYSKFERDKCINLLQKKNYSLANDSKGEYFTSVASYYQFNTCSWNKLEGYTFKHPQEEYKNKITNCSYIIRLPIKNFKAFSDDNFSKEWLTKDSIMTACWDIETYTYDKNTGEPPKPKDNNFIIFMISITFHWYYTNNSLLKVCIMHVPNCKKTQNNCVLDNSSEFIIVECPNRNTIIQSFFDILGRMNIDFLIGFNNGAFDTPILLSEIEKLGLLLETKKKLACYLEYNDDNNEKGHANISSKNYRIRNIKISAEEKLTNMSIQMPGFIDTDARIIFKQLYPRAEVGQKSSLNYYLKLSKLDSKEDMPYNKMFAIYELFVLSSYYNECICEEYDNIEDTDSKLLIHTMKHLLENKEIKIDNKLVNYLIRSYSKKWKQLSSGCIHCIKSEISTEMDLVANYCVVDAFRCQQLFTARSVIAERREIANMSYVSLQDAFYKANGHKIRNLVASYCNQNSIMVPYYIPSRTEEEIEEDKKNKFPGAWVFPPIKGVNRKRPVTGLDFSSLYPSIMMAYNLSPDKIVFDGDQANKLKQLGYNLHEIDFECLDKKRIHAWSVRHNGIHEINGSGKIFNSFTTDHTPVFGRDSLPSESMGVLPYILRKLFNKRAEVKKVMNSLILIEEKLKLDPNTNFSEEELIKVDLLNVEKFDLSDIRFRISKLNAKQLALKVFMNTFYGEQGNSTSPSYVKEVAGGITTAGQYNIKMVAEFNRKNLYGVMYGDTDSVYITCPEAIFKELDDWYESKIDGLSDNDSLFYEIRKEYWTQMVKLTQTNINKWKFIVNEMLAEENGTEFLKMAYEEVLFPCVLTGKKKYFGIPHLENVNFNINTIKDLFIRGIDIIKQGQTDLSRQFGFEIMKAICDLYNNDDMIVLVKNKLIEIYKTNWDVHYFVTSGKYKTNVKNITMQTFYNRMKTLYNIHKHTNPQLAALYRAPVPGEPFEYLVIKKEQDFDIKGRKINLKKGDQMEYVRVYEHFKDSMQIDIDYYIDTLIGVFARFISYMPQFNPYADLDYDTSDDISTTLAKKYIIEFRDQLIGKNNDSIKQKGKQCKDAFKIVKKNVDQEMNCQLGNFYCIINDCKLQGESCENAFNNICAYSDKFINETDSKITSMYNFKLLKEHFNIFYLKKVYLNISSRSSLSMRKNNLYKKYLNNTNQHIITLLPKIINICNNFNIHLTSIIDLKRHNISADVNYTYNLTEHMIKDIAQLYNLLTYRIAIIRCQKDLKCLMEIITCAINKEIPNAISMEHNTIEENNNSNISEYNELSGYSVDMLVDDQ